MYKYIYRERPLKSVYYCDELIYGMPYLEPYDPPPFKGEEVNLSFLNSLKKQKLQIFP